MPITPRTVGDIHVHVFGLSQLAPGKPGYPSSSSHPLSICDGLRPPLNVAIHWCPSSRWMTPLQHIATLDQNFKELSTPSRPPT